MKRNLTSEQLENWRTKSRASAAKIKLDNPDHFKEIGQKGGWAKVPKGFAVSGLAKTAGTMGGSVKGADYKKYKLKGNTDGSIRLTRTT